MSQAIHSLQQPEWNLPEAGNLILQETRRREDSLWMSKDPSPSLSDFRIGWWQHWKSNRFFIKISVLPSGYMHCLSGNPIYTLYITCFQRLLAQLDESWADSKRLRPEKKNQSEDFPRNSKNRKMIGNTRKNERKCKISQNMTILLNHNKIQLTHVFCNTQPVRCMVYKQTEKQPYGTCDQVWSVGNNPSSWMMYGVLGHPFSIIWFTDFLRRNSKSRGKNKNKMLAYRF